MADPIIVYLVDHGFSDGNYVTIEDVSGLGEANGVFEVYDKDDDSFKLKRTVDGAELAGTVVEVEHADDTYEAGGKVVESMHVLSNLDHLEGMTVAVWGDGAELADDVVEDGTIVLSEYVSNVVAGLPFRSNLRPMRIDISTLSQTLRGINRRLPELIISFYNTLHAKYGIDVDTLYDIDWRTSEVYGTPPALYTGDKDVVLDGGFDPEDPILISSDSPAPCTVRAITVRMKVTGR